MTGFSDYSVWSFILIIAILFAFMMIAHILRRKIPFLNKSLLPPSVLGGVIILIFTSIYQLITKENFFELEIFSMGNLSGTSLLEIITYHALAVGFICMGLRSSENKKQNKKRTTEIFNTGVTTVSTYLIQAVVGLIVTMLSAVIVTDLEGFNPAAGIILCLGYGQGTGQALNFGRQYEQDYGFINGANFGLAVAAMGFLVASIGGVIVLNVLKRKGKIVVNSDENSENLNLSHYQKSNEIPVNGSIDKLTIQVAIVVCIYAVVYGVMYVLGLLVPGMKATIFGFNFLLGTLFAVLFKAILNRCQKKKLVNHIYINDFMMNRIGGVAFDIMIVAGIAAIDMSNLQSYLGILLIMGALGAIVTFAYVMFVSKKLFKDYAYEQFFAMYGMLTGTASTGMILLREIDPNFETPVSDNLVYQNLPAIIFGLPIMFLVPYAAKGWTETITVFIIVIVLLIILLLILFRSFIFKKKKKVE